MERKRERKRKKGEIKSKLLKERKIIEIEINFYF
jgi:hypothetical protein